MVDSVRPLVDKVVVVDDGSSDQTYELAKGQGATVLRHLLNRGQGAALETGNQYALARGADIIVHFDADEQFLAGEIKDAVQPIISGEADVVFGSRFLDKKSQMPWLKKNIIYNLARFISRILFGVNTTDPQGGFRAMSAEAASKITIEQDGMAHCSEILIKAFKNKLAVKEVSITVIYNNFGQGIFGGKGRGSGGIRIIGDLLLSKIILSL